MSCLWRALASRPRRTWMLESARLELSNTGSMPARKNARHAGAILAIMRKHAWLNGPAKYVYMKRKSPMKKPRNNDHNTPNVADSTTCTKSMLVSYTALFSFRIMRKVCEVSATSGNDSSNPSCWLLAHQRQEGIIKVARGRGGGVEGASKVRHKHTHKQTTIFLLFEW